MGNLSFNPISALTHATLDILCEDRDTRQVLRAMMLEAKAIGEKLGVNFPIDVEQRINGGAAVGSHKTSMLQDLELARPFRDRCDIRLSPRIGSNYKNDDADHRYCISNY